MNSLINLFICSTKIIEYLPCNSALKVTWDLFESGVIRHADLKMIVKKEEVYTQKAPESGDRARHAMQGPVGEGSGSSQEVEGGKGKCGQEFLLWFLQKDLMR